MTTDVETNYTTKTDLYQTITNKIISDLEKGELTWRKPWSADHLASRIQQPQRANHEYYSGVNVLMLWATAADKGYQSPYWFTYNQALNINASVRRGEKGAHVVYADKFVKEEQNDKGETVQNRIPFLKSYTVFNAAQIERLPELFYQTLEPVIINPETRDKKIDAMFAITKLKSIPAHRQATIKRQIAFKCHRLRASYLPKIFTPPWRMSFATGPSTKPD